MAVRRSFTRRRKPCATKNECHGAQFCASVCNVISVAEPFRAVCASRPKCYNFQTFSMEFRCRLVTAAGEIVEGTYAAESESRLRHELENQGLHVLALRKRSLLANIEGLPQRRRIPKHEFLVFNQEFATLLKAGMPLVQSLDLLRAQVTNPLFKSVLEDVHEKVRGGMALSDAFGDHGELFPRVYTASLLAGERSGNLDAILRRYVSYEKIVDTVRRKAISALIYPIILIVLAIGLVGLIVLKVVPAFSDFYASFNAELPMSTRIIVGVSDVMQAEFGLDDVDNDARRFLRNVGDAGAGLQAEVKIGGDAIVFRVDAGPGAVNVRKQSQRLLEARLERPRRHDRCRARLPDAKLALFVLGRELEDDREQAEHG